MSKPSALAQNSATCGPFGADTVYITAGGQNFNGTRMGLGPDFANDDFDASVGNSNFNSFQVSLRHTGKTLSLSVGYTNSKSIDQSSSISDPLNPFNLSATRTLSAFDLTHDFVASYLYQVPLDRLLGRLHVLTRGWAVSGITRATSGFPVTLREDGDNSLMGSIPNGVNNHTLDLPDYNGLPLQLNSNPRNGQVFFNTSAFGDNALGTPGNASRRPFHGPGEINVDLTLLRNFEFSEAGSVQFRFESFNTFNHAQFFGPASVQGDVDSTLFGQVIKAEAPRLLQIALKRPIRLRCQLRGIIFACRFAIYPRVRRSSLRR